MALCQDCVRQCGRVDNTIDIVEISHLVLPQKSDYWATFEAKCISALKKSLRLIAHRFWMAASLNVILPEFHLYARIALGS